MGGLFGGGGDSAKTQTVTQQNNPPAYLAPYLTDIAKRSSAAYADFLKKGYNMPYSGPRSAGQNSFDTKAQTSALSALPGFATAPQQTYDLGQFFSNKVNSGAYQKPGDMAFNSGDNESTNAAVMASVKPILQDFQENIIPSLQSKAITSGALHGGKQADIVGRAARDTQNTIGDLAAKISYQDFAARRQIDQADLSQRRALMPTLNAQEMQAGGMVPGLNSQAFAQALQPSSIYSTAADQTRGFAQQGINDKMTQYNELVNSPFAGLGPYAGLVQGTALPGTGTSATNTMGYAQPGSNFLSGLGSLGTLSGGASSLGAALPGMFQSGGMLGPAASFVGPSMVPEGIGTLASILGFLSDKRLKENIEFLGIENGHKVYTYNYLWDKTKRVGVLAQEVLAKAPEAVGRIGEYLTVNYSMIGVRAR